jgi:hypothetical protein
MHMINDETGKDEATKTAEQPSPVPVDGRRRDALRRIGKLGAYTAPALLVMLASEKAPAATAF